MCRRWPFTANKQRSWCCWSSTPCSFYGSQRTLKSVYTCRNTNAFGRSVWLNKQKGRWIILTGLQDDLKFDFVSEQLTYSRCFYCSCEAVDAGLGLYSSLLLLLLLLLLLCLQRHAVEPYVCLRICPCDFFSLTLINNWHAPLLLICALMLFSPVL